MENRDPIRYGKFSSVRISWAKTAARIRQADSPLKRFVYVYAAYFCWEHNITSISQFQKEVGEVSDDRRLFLIKVNPEDWESIKFLSDDYKGPILSYNLTIYDGPLTHGFFNMPDSLGKLALRVMDVKETDHIADFGGGYTNFLTEINTESIPYCITTSVDAKEMVLIKNEMRHREVKAEYGNIFDFDKSYSFDKIFAESPIGPRPLKNNAPIVGYDRIMKSVPGMEKVVSYTWLVAASVLEHLNKNGMAVLLAPLGSLSNTKEDEVRKYFAKYIQAVIALGPGLLLDTQIPTALIVLGKNDTDTIRMIDARKIIEEGRGQNYLSYGDIDTVVDALTKDSNITIDVSTDELEKNYYSLNPAIYCNKIDIKNGVPFADVAVDITRGMPLSAGKLDGLVSDTPTGIQYLQLSDIQDGMIRSDLPYLKSMDKEYENYMIKRDCIILSRTGSPAFKMAVAEFETDAKVIGSGNLYIIELDQEKMNPYFLKAFLESRDGQLSLKRISAGSVLENISIRALKTLEVPCPAMSEQNRIAEEYKKKEDAVRALSKKLDEAKQALKNVYKGGEK